MLIGVVLLVLLQILAYLNRQVLGEGEEAPNGQKPICSRSEPKWTEQQIESQCNDERWVNGLYSSKAEMACYSRMKGERTSTPECCTGYKKANQTWCVADCKVHCEHGECDNDGRCSCSIGFGGLWCQKPCPAGHFGAQCEHNCECLLSQECNPNYQHCKCSGGNVTEGCGNICKCRFNLCNPGLIGKNCSVACPNGTYGQFCSKTCSCVEENTSECLKEHGDCACKNGFYGMHCERQCTGILTCDKPNPNICTCQLTLEQKLEASNKRSENLILGLVCASVLLFGLLFLIYRYKTKSKNLKNELKDYSLRYSSDETKVEFTNPIYSSSLLDDSTLPLTNPAETQQNEKKSFLGFVSSMTKGWFKPKTGRLAINETPKNETPKNVSNQVDEEKDKIYSTISDMKDGKKSKDNEPTIKF